MDLVSGFPKNLAYTLKQLSNFTKQTVKVIPDRMDPKFGEVTRFKLPGGAMIDFRTISIYADVTLFSDMSDATNTSYSLHLPRNTGSLIEQITVTCNGVQLCNINDYNVLYNTLYDLEGADYSQNSKRLLENADPSIYYYRKDTTAENSPIGIVNACGNNVNNKEIKRPIVINNFLGFISSLSTPVLDLNDTGDIFIEIRWASANVLWASNNVGTVVPAANVGNNKFENVRMTCSKINFESGEYFNLKSQKLLSDGLMVGYYDYWTARGSAVDKSAGVSMNFNVATNSLDQCIATFQKHDYQTVKHLVLHGVDADTDAAGVAAFINYQKYLSDIPSYTTAGAGIGDGFNQSYYFMRAGADLATSQWSINSTNIDPYPLPPSEIWNQNLIALGNQNLDFGTSGVHSSCVSLYHFLKYYFCHILSLENLSGDGQFWRSGLSGNGSTVNITYNATFDKQGQTTTAEKIAPIIFCRSTKVLSVRDGHIISVV